MSSQSFSLIPFRAGPLPSIRLTGTVSLEDAYLTIRYLLSGDVEEVSLPPVSQPPGRRDELWQATCFEFFLATKADPGYWEFNLSPSGDWNVYRMDAYRRLGFRQEPAIEELLHTFKKEADRYLLEAAVDLGPILPPGQAVELAVSAIVQTNDGRETYWALSHPGSVADFHLRESFILELAGQTALG